VYNELNKNINLHQHNLVEKLCPKVYTFIKLKNVVPKRKRFKIFCTISVDLPIWAISITGSLGKNILNTLQKNKII